MSAHGTIAKVIVAVAALLLVAPVALADTCCANTPVTFEPRSAEVGDKVTLHGMRCLHADNSGGVPLNLGSFWLWKGDRPADVDPDTAPGPGLPQDLPPVEQWHPFDSADTTTGGPGDAVITIPKVRDGTYQLWWWCDDGSGPGGGIHYSTGPRLAIGVPPDTATADAGPMAARGEGGGVPWTAWLLGGIGTIALVGGLLVAPWRRARSGRAIGRR